MYRLGALVATNFLTLIGLGATILLSGGWQAAAGVLAISAGTLCVLSYISLIAGPEPPRRMAPAPRDLPESAAPEPTTTAARRSTVRPVQVVKTHG